MDFEEFCAAALRVHQLEGLDRWEQQTRDAYEIFEQDGNKSIVVDELASVSWLLILRRIIALALIFFATYIILIYI